MCVCTLTCTPCTHPYRLIHTDTFAHSNILRLTHKFYVYTHLILVLYTHTFSQSAAGSLTYTLIHTLIYVTHAHTNSCLVQTYTLTLHTEKYSLRLTRVHSSTFIHARCARCPHTLMWHMLTSSHEHNVSSFMPGTMDLPSIWLLLDVPSKQRIGPPLRCKERTHGGNIWESLSSLDYAWIFHFLVCHLSWEDFVTHQMARATTEGWLSLCQTSSATIGSISVVTVFT